MNARMLMALGAERDRLCLPRGVPLDTLMPAYGERVVGLVREVYRALTAARFPDPACPNGYWPDPDGPECGPCRWCKRTMEEHRHDHTS